MEIAIGIAVVIAIVVAVLVMRGKKPAELEGGDAPVKLPPKKESKAKPTKSERPKAAAKPASKSDDEDDDDEPLPVPTESAEKPDDEEDDDEDDEEDDDEGRPAPSGPTPSAPLSKRSKDVEGLRKGLSKARQKEGFFGRLRALFGGKKEIDPDLVDQIEEVLLTSDVGVKTTESLLAEIRDKLAKDEIADSNKVWEALRRRMREALTIGGGGIALSAMPTVVMFVGVNGVGKTTTIGKLATKLHAEGKTVVLAAGDTFRAAAVQQLEVWGKRVGCEVVRGKDGANPGAVIFDAIKKAQETGADIVLADTAGRLHTKSNLMDELAKVAKTMNKAMDGAPHETLLVLDATNGQNALQQAAMFKETLDLSGIVLTKLDGTAKGGVILGICEEHQLPVRYIGIGERPDDLRDFIADEFVEALLGGAGDSSEEAA